MGVETRELYRSPNGDRWCLGRHSDAGRVFIRHEPNVPSGGQVADIEVGAFLSQGGQGPEKQELLRLIGTLADPAPTNPYVQGWHALLAENDAIQKQHLELISSFTQPFSRQQMAQLEASTARLQKLNLKLHDLVDEWSADARPT